MLLDILITLLVIIIIFCLWVVLYDCNHFVVKEMNVINPCIRKEAKAVVIADLHNKQYGKNNELLLTAIKEQEPDIILVAGDMIYAAPGKTLEPAIHLLKELSGEYPIYYGNGNHEYRLKLYPSKYPDMGEAYEQALREIGVVPMVNEHALLSEFGICIYGAEIDRCYYKRFRVNCMESEYLNELLGRVDKQYCTVLLAHNPEYFPQYAAWGADLTVSGHVHGGIARIPFWGKGVIAPSMHLFPKYDGGVFREGSSVMLLSRGLGTHTIPIRFNNPGELWVVHFKTES